MKNCFKICCLFFMIFLSFAVVVSGQKKVEQIQPKASTQMAKAELATKKSPYIDPKVYVKVDEQPDFKGGMEGFYELLRKHIDEKSLNSNTLIEFKLDEEGKAYDLHFVGRKSKNIAWNNLLDDMPYWKPGYNNGIPVKVQMSLPLKNALIK